MPYTIKRKLIDHLISQIDLNSQENIYKLRIYICNTKCNGSQLWINFSKATFSSNINMELIYFEQYVKVSDKIKVISLYGELYELIITLIINELNKLVSFNDKSEFNISFSDTDLIPSISKSIIYTINKNSTELVYDCPVCKELWEEHKNLKLKCGHRLCRKCLFRILNSDNAVCPICRKGIL